MALEACMGSGGGDLHGGEGGVGEGVGVCVGVCVGVWGGGGVPEAMEACMAM